MNDTDTQRILALARAEARRYRHQYIRGEHLLLALCRGGGAAAIALRAAGVDETRLDRAVAAMPCPTCEADEKLTLSATAQRAFDRAEQPVTPSHLLDALLNHAPLVRKLLAEIGVSVQDVWRALEDDKGDLHDQ